MTASGFVISYWVGVAVGVAAALASLPFAWIPVRPSPFTMLAIGLPHMIVLSTMGWLLPREERAQAGARIETAGYLHTLFGFSAALALVGTSSSPVGSGYTRCNSRTVRRLWCESGSSFGGSLRRTNRRECGRKGESS